MLDLLRARHHSYLLSYLVRNQGWLIGVELGVFTGRTFEQLLVDCPKLYLIGVDAFRYMPKAPGGETYRNTDHCANRKRVEQIHEKYRNRSRLLEMTTDEAAPLIGEASCDFVFVDADHSQAGVHADISNWWDKVKDGGCMLGHDYDEKNWPGVVAAVNESFGDYNVIALPGNIWAVRKDAN